MDTQSETHKTPANAVNNRQELMPLPLRVASSQKSRLAEARDRTGISIQEHVRRSIDLYLAVIEREAIELGLMQDRFPARGLPPPITGVSPTRQSTPKVKKR